MKSLQRRFNNIAKRNPAMSTLLCFANAVMGQKFSMQKITKYFYRLVDKNDYPHRDKDLIVKEYFDLSQGPHKEAEARNPEGATGY